MYPLDTTVLWFMEVWRELLLGGGRGEGGRGREGGREEEGYDSTVYWRYRGTLEHHLRNYCTAQLNSCPTESSGFNSLGPIADISIRCLHKLMGIYTGVNTRRYTLVHDFRFV